MDIFRRERHLDLSEKKTIGERMTALDESLKKAHAFIDNF
jgi:hypothetical protein